MAIKFTNWQVQDYFNEYLELKDDLLKKTSDLEVYKRFNLPEKEDTINSIKEKSERLMYVLEQLELSGVSMKDLVILGCGVDPQQ